MDDENTITITGSGASGSNDTIVINLNDTYGATTSYINNVGIIAQDIDSLHSSFTISSGVSDYGTISITDPQWWINSEGTHFEIAEIEKMCSEYPALAKVYENFKTMYDLVKQDWEGKKNAENNS
jgi:hypothetical protein